MFALLQVTSCDLKQIKEVSNDSDFLNIITTCKQKILPTGTIMTPEDVIKTAMSHTIVQVGNDLLISKATLLPTVHDTFNDFASTLIAMRNLQGIKDVKALVTSRWILSNLTATLQHHMTYTCRICRICKYGTVIYRTDSDLVSSLSQALWDVRTLKSKCSPVVTDKDDAQISRLMMHVKRF